MILSVFLISFILSLSLTILDQTRKGRSQSNRVESSFLELQQLEQEGNYAIEFNGIDQYVLIKDSASLDSVTEEMTLSAWIRINQYPIDYASIISKEQSYQMVLLSNGSLGYSVETSSASFLRVKSLGGNIPLGTWTFVTVLYDGSTLISFIDRQPTVKPNSGSGTIIPSDFPMGIAARYSGGEWSNFFSGTIDEVQIYSRSISIREVEREYERQDYELSPRDINLLAEPGDTITNTVDLTLIKGPRREVSISISGVPPNSNFTLTPSRCLLPCSVDIMITTTLDTPIGRHTITVSSNPSTTYDIIIQNTPLGGINNPNQGQIQEPGEPIIQLPIDISDNPILGFFLRFGAITLALIGILGLGLFVRGKLGGKPKRGGKRKGVKRSKRGGGRRK